MEYVLGAFVVVAVLTFVLLPLLRGRPVDALTPAAPDPAQSRAEIYRELLELELDQKVGKIAEPDYRELSDALLARAAALISLEDAESTALDAALEREIAGAREAIQQARLTVANSLPAEETPA